MFALRRHIWSPLLLLVIMLQSAVGVHIYRHTCACCAIDHTDVSLIAGVAELDVAVADEHDDCSSHSCHKSADGDGSCLGCSHSDESVARFNADVVVSKTNATSPQFPIVLFRTLSLAPVEFCTSSLRADLKRVFHINKVSQQFLCVMLC